MKKIDLKKIFKTHGKVDDENGIFFEQLVGLGFRKISDIIINRLKNSKITPNQITIARSLILLPIIFYFFSRGDQLSSIIGFVCAMVNSLFDVLDGQLARAKSIVSKLGAFLDDISDRLTSYLVFTAIILGAYRVTQNNNILIMGVFVLFFHGMLAVISEKYGLAFGGYEAFFGLRIKEAVLNNEKSTWLDKLFLNLFGFYSVPSYLFFAVRYQLLLGVIFNIMPYVIFYWVFAFAFRAVFLFILYTYIVRERNTGVFFINELRKIYAENMKLEETNLGNKYGE
ncbi:MAG: CDP-alcohol phosphatidyltransferase family protein [Candidatus Falkowbacteria bacterium]|nr:CDP-alcohol phosphatidyltransferase family protein [Candidatus Falkowbacteria bacterium]